MSGTHSAGRRRIALATGLVAAALLARPAAAERPNATKLLPKTTAALVWVPDAPELAERYRATSLGQMFQDPQIKPLVGQLYGSAVEAVANVQDRIGLSLPEILGIPQGEMAVALVAHEDGPPELVALLDVGDQRSNARKLLERAGEALEKSGARKTEKRFGDAKAAVYEGVGEKRRTLILFEKGSTVVVGSSAEVVRGVVKRWNGDGDAGDALAGNARFASVMRRSGRKDLKPHLVWYADPIALVRSIGQENPGVQMSLAVFPVLGLDGVKVLGGSFTFDAGRFDSVAVWHLLLDPPREGVVKMIAFKPGPTEPEPWVPADAASYMTLDWDFNTTFDEFTRLYDGFQGEGALSDVLGARAKDSIGLDVEKELIPALAGRVSLCSRIQRPVTVRSAATVVGFQLNDPKAFGEVLDRVTEKHEVLLQEKSYGGREYFQVAVPERPNGPPPPIPCFGIVGDYLILANHPGLYEQVVLTSQGAAESLAGSLEFKLVAGNLERQSGGARPAMIGFERPQEGLRFYHDLANTDQVRDRLRESAEENPFLRELNTALDDNPLPPFAVIEQYFAPGGSMLVDDESGLHYMSFSLRRNAEAGEEAEDEAEQ